MTDARAYTPADFCAAYRIGKTKFYEEVRDGHLAIRKVGRRTLVLAADAEAWERSLVGRLVGRNEAEEKNQADSTKKRQKWRRGCLSKRRSLTTAQGRSAFADNVLTFRRRAQASVDNRPNPRPDCG